MPICTENNEFRNKIREKIFCSAWYGILESILIIGPKGSKSIFHLKLKAIDQNSHQVRSIRQSHSRCYWLCMCTKRKTMSELKSSATHYLGLGQAEPKTRKAKNPRFGMMGQPDLNPFIFWATGQIIIGKVKVIRTFCQWNEKVFKTWHLTFFHRIRKTQDFWAGQIFGPKNQDGPRAK